MVTTVAAWLLVITNTLTGQVTTQIMPTEKSCKSAAVNIMLSNSDAIADCEKIE